VHAAARGLQMKVAVMPPVQGWNLTQRAVHLDVLADFDRHGPSRF